MLDKPVYNLIVEEIKCQKKFTQNYMGRIEQEIENLRFSQFSSG